jgi:hypothetical protein
MEVVVSPEYEICEIRETVRGISGIVKSGGSPKKSIHEMLLKTPLLAPVPQPGFDRPELSQLVGFEEWHGTGNQAETLCPESSSNLSLLGLGTC